MGRSLIIIDSHCTVTYSMWAIPINKLSDSNTTITKKTSHEPCFAFQNIWNTFITARKWKTFSNSVTNYYTGSIFFFKRKLSIQCQKFVSHWKWMNKISTFKHTISVKFWWTLDWTVANGLKPVNFDNEQRGKHDESVLNLRFHHLKSL